jgi:hypothetical protein
MRLGDSHGLLRALDARGRLRVDEFATEFAVEELYPPGLESACARRVSCTTTAASSS